MILLIRILLLLILFSFDLSTIASAEAPLTAAFIRDHQLWIKKGNQEIQLTKNRYVYNQKWSYDGRFIGYIDGDEKREKSDLFIYDTKENESYQPYVRVVTSFSVFYFNNFCWFFTYRMLTIFIHLTVPQRGMGVYHENLNFSKSYKSQY
jgi:hypothetical protein